MGNLTDFPPPSVFGLPARFAHWRQDQVQAFNLILDSPKRFIALCMPTGSGKSLAYMAALHLQGGRGVALTSTKGLQDQIVEDFGSLGVWDVRGQRNYACRAMQKEGEWAHLYMGSGVPTVDEGPCHAGVQCTLKEAGCDYYDSIRIGTQARILSTNYAAWLAQRRYAQGLGKADILVCDEAHQALDELSDSLTITVDKWLLGAVGLESVPPQGSISDWKQWAAYHAHRLKSKLEGMSKPISPSDLKYRKRCKAAARVLQQVADMGVGEWVEDHTADSWVFACVQPAKYAEAMLWQGAKKVVLTSATLTPKTLTLLGIPLADAVLWECPSRFAVERRPVIHIPTCQVDMKMKPGHWDMWCARIDQVVSQRPAVKGIIHTVSYKRRDTLLARSKHAERFVTHESKTLLPQVQYFKKHPGDLWLVSPSIMTGWDFPGAQCRVQIIAKLPFPDTRSKVLKARCEIDPDYMPYLTMQAFMQAVGRGMRSEQDWCETIVVDDHVKWFIWKYRKLAPHYFLQSFRTSLTLPKPLAFAA